MQQLFKRLADWEKWPWNVFYFPLSFVWAWYCLKSRSVWFFSASNPTLAFGGFEGEGKKEMYDQLPLGSYPKTVYVSPTETLDAVQDKFTANGFQFPLAVKPDVGMKGLLFRKINNFEQLVAYHVQCPVDYLLQEWVDYPIELGVFYCRMPNEEKGKITGLTRKEPVIVLGDGQLTLLQLIEQHQRAQKYLDALMYQHKDHLDLVIPAGELYPVTIAANRNRGARLYNLMEMVDDDLLRIFDHISHKNGAFFYGRYDIKCQSIEDLKKGENYTILEFNGAGAAPNHIYHCGLSLREAYQEMIAHWRLLYQISRYNHRHGHKYWSFLRGWRYLHAAKRHFNLLYQLESKI